MDWLRRFTRRTPRMEIIEYPTDARPVEGHPRQPDPEAELRRKLRRSGLAFVVTSCIVAATLAALFSAGGFFDLRQMQAEFDSRAKEVEETRARVEALRREIERLETDPMARERIAREQLGLVRPGEIDFLLPRQAATDAWNESRAEPDPSGPPVEDR